MKTLVCIVIGILCAFFGSLFLTKVFAKRKIGGTLTRLFEARFMWACSIILAIITFYLIESGYLPNLKSGLFLIAFFIISFVVFTLVAFYYNRYELLIKKDKITLNTPFVKSNIITHENLISHFYTSYKGRKFHVFVINNDGKAKHVSIYNHKNSLDEFFFGKEVQRIK
ncbi:hypothetical protein HV819_10160 [Anaerococcus sp. AGMB00486]|uniref:DUF5673 domain-containing protein n=1 Tax=Anaerococcus faecalis TaxID=2742993 RepID=A0ABX2NC92_9FIRM|nr:hypothetical protein [Anaerococcus faecalis]NVF12319.1 hypothetical protein [Anaerococcus faecalis]